MASNRYFSNKNLTVYQQMLGIKNIFPTFNTTINKNELCSEGILKPSSLSAEYKIRIKYKQDKAPDCYVIEPRLALINGEKEFEHIYSIEDQQLCLYYPKNKCDWNPTISIAKNNNTMGIRVVILL